jgi:hypothetical protein
MKNQETKKAKLFVEFYQKFNLISVSKNFGATATNAMARMYPTNPNNNMMPCCCC